MKLALTVRIDTLVHRAGVAGVPRSAAQGGTSLEFSLLADGEERAER